MDLIERPIEIVDLQARQQARGRAARAPAAAATGRGGRGASCGAACRRGGGPRSTPISAASRQTCSQARANASSPSGAEQRARKPRAHAGQPDGQRRRQHPRAERHDREQPELTERTLGGLPPKLRRERLLGAPALGLDLRAFEIHSRAVAVERLFERGDDDAGEPCLERAARPARAGVSVPTSIPAPTAVFRPSAPAR